MPEREEVYTPGQTKPKFVGPDKQKLEELEDAKTKQQFGSTAGKGLGSLGRKGFVPPKQDAGEDSSAYATRVRKARTAHEDAEAQKRALSK